MLQEECEVKEFRGFIKFEKQPNARVSHRKFNLMPLVLFGEQASVPKGPDTKA